MSIKKTITATAAICVAVSLTACAPNELEVGYGLADSISSIQNVSSVDAVLPDVLTSDEVSYVVKAKDGISIAAFIETAQNAADKIIDAAEDSNWTLHVSNGSLEIGASASVLNPKLAVDTGEDAVDTVPAAVDGEELSTDKEEGASSFERQVALYALLADVDGISKIKLFDSPVSRVEVSVDNSLSAEDAFGLVMAKVDEAQWEVVSDFSLILNFSSTNGSPMRIVSKMLTSSPDTPHPLTPKMVFPETAIEMYRAVDAAGIDLRNVELETRGRTEKLALFANKNDSMSGDLMREINTAVATVKTPDSKYVQKLIRVI